MTNSHDDQFYEGVAHVSAALLDVVEELEAAYEAEPCPRPEELYMYDYFDEVFAPGSLVVLYGNSEIRNLLFFAEMVNQAAYDSCCVLSRDSKLFARSLLMKKSGLSYKKICGREWFAEEDWDHFTDVLAQLNSSKFFIGHIPSNVSELDALIRREIVVGRISSDEARYQLFVDSLEPLLDAAHFEDRGSSALLSLLSELKRVAVARRLQVCVVHHAHEEANWTEEQSVIARHADAVLMLESRPDRRGFGQEANCTFSMSINGQVAIEQTSLRIDAPM